MILYLMFYLSFLLFLVFYNVICCILYVFNSITCTIYYQPLCVLMQIFCMIAVKTVLLDVDKTSWLSLVLYCSHYMWRDFCIKTTYKHALFIKMMCAHQDRCWEPGMGSQCWSTAARPEARHTPPCSSYRDAEPSSCSSSTDKWIRAYSFLRLEDKEDHHDP